MSHIPNEVFTTFRNLEQIFVPNASLKEINRLENCDKLFNFYAPDNQIEEIKRESFENCKKIDMFYFDNNPIKKIGARFFYPNEYYLYFGFSNCNIEEIDPAFFDGLIKIDFLGLTNNTCVNRNFFSIKPRNVGIIKLAMETCFNNFEKPSDPVPTTIAPPIATTTDSESASTPAGPCVEDKPKLVCKFNAETNLYHCEADFQRITFIED